MPTPPSIEQWRKLYEAARLFREHTPSDVLSEDRLFAVEVPGADPLYCGVLGSADGQAGLIATRGARGLLGYIMLTGDELDEDERPTEQDGLSFLLGDGQLLNDEDRAVHAELGLKFEGDAAWPLFRSLRPHRLAVAPDADEVAALTVAIQQANALAKSIRDGVELPEVAADEVLARQRDSKGAWQTVVIGMPAPPPAIRLEADPVRCAVVLRRGRRSREVWEATMMTLGTVDSEDGTESFWARLLLCVDKDSKQVVGGEVLGPDVSPQHALIAAIEKGGTIPRTLDVTSGLLESQLKPLTDVLKVRLRRVEQLPVADALRGQMRASVVPS